MKRGSNRHHRLLPLFLLVNPNPIYVRIVKTTEHMEITIDTLINIGTLLLGGGGGAFFTWRWQRKKAKADAKEAEAEAEKAKFEAMQANAQLIKDIQSSYQQLTADLKTNLDTQQEYNEEQKQYIQELKDDRNHLREDRNDLRERIEKTETTVRNLQREVDQNARMVKSMRPFLCGMQACPDRVLINLDTDRPQHNQDHDTHQ